MRDAVIVEAVRTPVGKRGGSLLGFANLTFADVLLRPQANRIGPISSQTMSTGAMAPSVAE